MVTRYDVGCAASLCLCFWLRFKFQILTLKPPTKCSRRCRLLKSSAAYDFLTLLTFFGAGGNVVDPDWVAPKGAV